MPSPEFKPSNSLPSGSAAPAKKLAVPRRGSTYQFEDLTSLVWVSCLWNKSAGVLCLGRESLDRWTGWLERFPNGLPSVEVLDLDQATLADWQHFLRGRGYDTVILHGAYAELRAGRLSTGYLAGLIDAIPAGVVVVA